MNRALSAHEIACEAHDQPRLVEGSVEGDYGFPGFEWSRAVATIRP
jgi:hypothetical protein